ncbi:CENP-S associating centromere protein X-domain-containing protein [Emericellopsis atlantica]|uniref:CENP-S associating centromere protein X-domain-containing protein n=1 Tax=Emericellopsis atlantica TaxID=2614577 RepID=A0A9P7ZTC4_9HYPO|nr:CENP-S associating centromere protein X-domain-containing protein [Emericellopsis atlantica]KAG9257741.1 CENP-S associating centromere protein X-domain-containing protein [Emericellopsis atlantica]
MPPQNNKAKATRGRPPGAKAPSKPVEDDSASDPFASEVEEDVATARPSPPRAQPDEAESSDDKTIPRDLLTRLLHEFFAKDTTRISKDANASVGKYVDVFVREALARTAVEKRSGFLEVEDLEKVTPQLMLDL